MEEKGNNPFVLKDKKFKLIMKRSVEMYIYHIPYFEDNRILTEIVYSEETKTIAELLTLFLDEVQYGYLDESYEEEPIDFLLDVVVNHYQISHINVHKVKENQKTVSSVFAIRELYDSYDYFLRSLDALEEMDTILLSTETVYDRDVHSDWVNFLYNGVETFLFSYSTIEAREEQENNEDEQEEIEFNHDIVIPNELFIDKPIKKEEQLVDLFNQWASALGINVADKEVRLAKREDFKHRPRLEKLERVANRLEEERFAIPSHLVFWNKEDVPPFDELVEMLKKETPETIACVLDEFSNEYIIRVLDALDNEETAIEVMKKFPSIPTLTFEERKRFFDLFEYEEKFALSRIKIIQSRYPNFRQMLLNPHKNEEEMDDVNEYLVWEWMLKENK